MKPSEDIAYPQVSAHAYRAQSIPLLVLLAAALLIGIVYLPTSLSMYEKWESSAGYSHGYIVLPVCLWLIWRKRDELAQTPFRPSWLGFLALAGAGLFWLLGSLGGVETVKQFGLVFIVIGLVWAALGERYTWALGFPLAYLLLAVPFGGGLIPYLMDWTAHAVVWALRLTGVPVYQDATNFVIPSGSWSVVEACAGSRYLISSLVVGTLFAYLNFRRLRTRALFFIACLIVPLIANWVRAYAIVMTAHLTDNEYGVSVGHLTLGWVIFGASMLALFWWGSRWADAEPAPLAGSRSFMAVKPSAAWPRALAAVLAAFAVAAAWQAISLYRQPDPAPLRVEFGALPAVGGWQASEQSARDVPFQFAGADGLRVQSFEKDGQRVTVLLTYYRQQREGRELIHYLNGVQVEENWRTAGRAHRAMEIGDQAYQFFGHRYRYPTGGLTYLSCYWVVGEWTCSEFAVKARQAASRLLFGRDDSAQVVLFVDRSGVAEADDMPLLAAFWQDYGHIIAQQIEQAYAR